ncbi:MAG: MFS transporter [Candidatus Nanopelagicaceae bacterium]
MSKIKLDAYFWTVCGQVTILNFFLGGFGPAQPLLREEQNTSLTVAGLHGTAMGIAAIISSFIQSGLVHKLGRKNTSWLGLAIFTAALPLFALGTNVYMTLIGVLIACIGFNFVIMSSVPLLSHHYPKHADVVVSQSNGINSAGYVFGTVLVGTLATWGISWRLGLLLCLPAAVAIYLFGRNKINDAHDHEAVKQSGKLSRGYWLAWLGFFASIASEFATAFWAASLITDRTGAAATISTICVAALGSGMGIGRWFLPIWLKNYTIDKRLQLILYLQLVAFAIFWLSHNLQVSLIALLFVGIGISGQFSLSMLRLIRLSDNRPDLAMGRSSLAAGLAIATSPFFLAFLGDHIGISRAYLMVPVIIAVAIIALKFASSEVLQQR